MTDRERKEDVEPDPPEASRWNGTLLKCPGCRLKFPFVADSHPLEIRRFPPNGPGGRERETLVTHCPHCHGWVTIT